MKKTSRDIAILPIKRKLTSVGCSLLLTGVISVSSSSANAQGSLEAAKDAALKTARQIEANSLIKDLSIEKELIVSNSQPEEQISIARNRFFESLPKGDLQYMQESLRDYRGAVEKRGTQQDKKVGELFETFMKHYEPQDPSQNLTQIITDIDPYLEDENWFVAFQAYALKCMAETYSIKRVDALQSAQTALKLIPNDLSSKAQEARIRITDVIVYLHNLQSNVGLAAENTQRLIDLKSQAGQSIDGIELLNNLIYSFGIWRDHETRQELAETLLRLEAKHDSTTPGLTDLRLARVYSEIGDFLAAERHAQAAKDNSQISSITDKAKIQLAIAKAGKGDANSARSILDDLGPINNYDQSYYLYAQALIALAEGRTLDAAKFFNRRLDHSVQKILIANSRDSTTLLASLENSRERQAEREKSLIREAELKQQKLDEQTKFNRLLLILLGLIAGALVASLLFARYRNRVSKLLAIKTREAESADRMKTEFLGMVSHELRTPLNGIIGIADFLHHRHSDSDVREKTGIILQSGNILFKLIEAIIDMARIDGGKLKLLPGVMPLLPTLTEVTESWKEEAAEKDLTYTYFIANDLDITAEYDDARLKQVLNALISNAMKFTDEGRVHVHITSEPTADGEVLLQAIIADTGMGISEEVQAKLFKPFLQADSSMTRKHNGSGLSLAITRSMARMMDGDITLVSKSGRGSEFKFTARLPRMAEGELALTDDAILVDPTNVTETEIGVQDAPVAAETAQAEPAPVELADDDMIMDAVLDLMESNDQSGRTALHAADKGPAETALPTPTGPQVDTDLSSLDLSALKILIVEDVPSNQDVLKLLLAPHGCQCLTADDGQVALDLLAHEQVDIILMDIRMPGMNGVEATRAIRDREGMNSQVPIIALTADVEASLNAECMAAGADLFLTKPIKRKELIEAVSFMHQHQRGKEVPLLLTQVAS